MRRAFLLSLLIGLASCAARPDPNAPVMPLSARGTPEMDQNEAIALADAALTHPEATRGNPWRAARAVAAAEWVAGQPDLTRTSPAAAQMPWHDLKRQLREAIGIAPDASPQIVVDRLMTTADALRAGQIDVVTAQLQPPVFALGPRRTLAVLSALPPFAAEQTASACPGAGC